MVTADHDGCYVSGEFPAFRVADDRLDPSYLLWWSRLASTRAEILALSSGSTAITRNRLRPERLLGLSVPLPPLHEQRSISRHLSALQSEIGEVRRRLADGSVVDTYLDDLFGDPYRARPGRMSVARWRPLGELVTDVADGPHKTPTYTDEGIPFVTALNVAPGVLGLTPVKYVSMDQHLAFQKRARAERGDILITKDGTIGLTCSVDTDVEFSFFVSVALVKPRPEALDGRFLMWLIRSPSTQRRIAQRARGDMIKHLVLREIRSLLCPAVALASQRAAVRDIERLAGMEGDVGALRRHVERDLAFLLPRAVAASFGAG